MINLDNNKKKLLVFCLLLSLFLAALDQTIVSTASPYIIKDLNSRENYFIITTSYLISFVMVLPVFGRLCDLVSHKILIIIANLIFLFGSFLCSISENLIQLSIFRFIQGIGGGGIFAIIFTTIGLLYAPRERGKIQGWVASIFGISSVVGPILGSFLTNFLSWHWIFLINIPIGIFVILMIQKFFPKISSLSNQKFDLLGAILLMIGTLAFLSSFNISSLSNKEKILLLTIGTAFYIVFYFYEKRKKEPLFDFELFRDPTFLKSGISTFFLGGTFISIIAFFPLYLTEKFKLDSIQMGNIITLLTLAVVFSSTISGKIAFFTGKYKNILIFSNFWLLIIFLLLFFIKFFSVLEKFEIFFIVIIGIGFGPILPLYVVAVQNSVPKKRLGTATSSIQFLRQLGASTGSSILGYIYNYFILNYKEKGIFFFFPYMMILCFIFIFLSFVSTLYLPNLELKNTNIE